MSAHINSRALCAALSVKLTGVHLSASLTATNMKKNVASTVTARPASATKSFCGVIHKTRGWDKQCTVQLQTFAGLRACMPSRTTCLRSKKSCLQLLKASQPPPHLLSLHASPQPSPHCACALALLKPASSTRCSYIGTAMLHYAQLHDAMLRWCTCSQLCQASRADLFGPVTLTHLVCHCPKHLVVLKSALMQIHDG